MASPLDLQEQEQLDSLKAFWKQWGNLITWLLVIVLGGIAGWNGWQQYQRSQAGKAGAMFDELDRAVQAADADKAARVFADLKERYPRTAFAQQGGLFAAKLLYDKSKADAAVAALQWVSANAIEDEYKAIANLRLAGIQAERKQYDEALKTVAAVTQPAFAALAADRRGDILMAQGKRDDAKAAFATAFKGMPQTMEYRQIVEAKLNTLGAAAPAEPASAAVGAAASAEAGAGAGATASATSAAPAPSAAAAPAATAAPPAAEAAASTPAAAASGASK
jgi:predicted negative regulator of RcsB-dependent stress response